MNAYHHGLQSDHRFQAASKTAHKVGDAFEVSGSSRMDWLKTAGVFLCIASAALVIDLAAYMAVWILAAFL